MLIFLKLDNNNKVIIVVNDVERHRCATQIIPNAKVPPRQMSRDGDFPRRPLLGGFS